MIDLPGLPKPNAIDDLDYEQIVNEMSNQLNGLQPLLFDGNLKPVTLQAELVTADNGEQYFKVPAKDVELYYLQLESDPLPKLTEVVAYREMLLRQRINDGTTATMLAYAQGADLEHEAARFNVKRLKDESDASLRRRAQLAMEGFSTAGPVGAYEYHTLSASPQVKAVHIAAPSFHKVTLTPQNSSDFTEDTIALQVLDDVGLTDPLPGDVAVTILSTEGDGHADPALINTVSNALNDDAVRPLTDRPRVRSVTVVNYTVEAVLVLHPGPDQSVVQASASKALNNYIADSQGIGIAPTLAGFYRALKQPGVYDVELTQPTAPIVVSDYQAAHCTSVTLSTRRVNG